MGHASEPHKDDTGRPDARLLPVAGLHPLLGAPLPPYLEQDLGHEVSSHLSRAAPARSWAESQRPWASAPSDSQARTEFSSWLPCLSQGHIGCLGDKSSRSIG